MGIETVLAKISAPTTNSAPEAKKSNGYDYDSKRIPEENCSTQPVPAPRRNNSIPNDTRQESPVPQPTGFHNDLASQVFL